MKSGILLLALKTLALLAENKGQLFKQSLDVGFSKIVA